MKNLIKKLFGKKPITITEEKTSLKVIRASSNAELKKLIEADAFFDAFDFELYYKIKSIKNS
jgi:hypothetical protein